MTTAKIPVTAAQGLKSSVATKTSASNPSGSPPVTGQAFFPVSSLVNASLSCPFKALIDLKISYLPDGSILHDGPNGLQTADGRSPTPHSSSGSAGIDPGFREVDLISSSNQDFCWLYSASNVEANQLDGYFALLDSNASPQGEWNIAMGLPRTKGQIENTGTVEIELDSTSLAWMVDNGSYVLAGFPGLDKIPNLGLGGLIGSGIYVMSQNFDPLHPLANVYAYYGAGDNALQANLKTMQSSLLIAFKGIGSLLAAAGSAEAALTLLASFGGPLGSLASTLLTGVNSLLALGTTIEGAISGGIAAAAGAAGLTAAAGSAAATAGATAFSSALAGGATVASAAATAGTAATGAALSGGATVAQAASVGEAAAAAAAATATVASFSAALASTGIGLVVMAAFITALMIVLGDAPRAESPSTHSAKLDTNCPITLWYLNTGIPTGFQIYKGQYVLLGEDYGAQAADAVKASYGTWALLSDVDAETFFAGLVYLRAVSLTNSFNEDVRTGTDIVSFNLVWTPRCSTEGIQAFRAARNAGKSISASMGAAIPFAIPNPLELEIIALLQQPVLIEVPGTGKLIPSGHSAPLTALPPIQNNKNALTSLLIAHARNEASALAYLASDDFRTSPWAPAARQVAKEAGCADNLAGVHFNVGKLFGKTGGAQTNDSSPIVPLVVGGGLLALLVALAK